MIMKVKQLLFSLAIISFLFFSCKKKISYQSPINISTGTVYKDSSLSPLFIDYYPIDSFKIKKNKNRFYITNLQGTVTSPDTTYWGHEYFLSMINIITPSEHSINNKKYPAELQFINIDSSGNILAIAVFIEKGSFNPSLSPIISSITKKLNNKIVYKQININELTSPVAQFWSYIGSLTFPPYKENVKWFVFKQPIYASQQQLDSLYKTLGNNARKIQELNNRKITEL